MVVPSQSLGSCLAELSFQPTRFPSSHQLTMRLLAAIALALAWGASLAEAKAVFAHFMVSCISFPALPAKSVD
jgi:hypothetical protein